MAKQTLGYYREHASASMASLQEIAEQALKIYEPRCTAAGITVERCLTSSRKIVLRRGEMMQVISNLIANAIYAMPTGGTLSVSVRDTECPIDGILLTVADNGVGVPADVLPRVFDALFTTRATVGTGIGLFVAKQFVEGHGGQITIDSHVESETRGTVVRVDLPTHTQYEPSRTSITAQIQQFRQRVQDDSLQLILDCPWFKQRRSFERSLTTSIIETRRRP